MINTQVGIVGAGNMGRAIAWAMEELGYSLLILDQHEGAIQNCQRLLRTDHKFFKGKSYDTLTGCGMVISSLPYHQNLNLATFCINNNIPYFDLGGNVGVSEAINTYATVVAGFAAVSTNPTENVKEANAIQPVMTDLGLAPGWVNIIAEEMYQEWRKREGESPETITMMVGGLPQQPNNTLQYSCTWSYDGLINEYRDDCIVLIDGKQTTVRGMDGYQFPVPSELGPLEAFYTSGGVAHTISVMKKRGVKNCSYKTLRYPNHHKMVNFLIHESGLDDSSLIEVFKRTCPPREDLVIIKVAAQDLTFEKVIRSDENFSAMQKATAFPIAAAAHTVSLYDISKPVLKYDDLWDTQFNLWLDRLFQGAR